MRDKKEEAYINPHHRYYAERFERRRARSRVSYIFLFFGLGVSALTILAAVMLFSIVGSFVG